MCPRQKELHFSWRGCCEPVGDIVWDNPVIAVIWNSKCLKRRVAPGVAVVAGRRMAASGSLTVVNT